MYKKFKHVINTSSLASISFDEKLQVVYLTGHWSWDAIDETIILNLANKIRISQITINGSEIKHLDTIGAFFLHKLLNIFKNNGVTTSLQLNEFDKILFKRIEASKPIPKTLFPHIKTNIITSLPLFKIVIPTLISFITFIGQCCVSSLQIIKHPSLLNWKEVTRTIYNAGFNGIFVILLLNFLIGTTLTYEMAPQFTKYGANIFIVNFLGISMLKEVSPLLTAILIAGRTGSSITAEIGVMKVQEEIDALKTMGISPIQRLVIPKILGILIATPLLTTLADIIGLIGGAIVSNKTLSITYTLFLERLQTYVLIYNYTDGLIKSVAFGLSIAFIGCFCGFRVQSDSNSIGEKTTSSVVQSIITIVFLDAVFAVIFIQLGI